MNSIKFKLTLWYSFILILSSICFLFIFNILITNYFENRFNPTVELELPPDRNQPFWFRALSEEIRENIHESRTEDLKKIREISLIMLVPLTVISFGGGYLISDRMLKPLKALNEKMSTITSKQLTETIEYVDSNDEISELIKNFNSMILRLKSSFDSQRQFVENASHELKTPLAVIQTNLSAVLEQKGVSKTEAEQLVKTAIRSTEFMDTLIEDLLLLSLLEQKIPMTTVDIGSSLKSVVDQLEVLAKRKGIGIEFGLKEGSYIVKGNESLLQRAVMNIVENAVKYSPEGSKVFVSIRKVEGKIVVEVKDSGPGISEADQKRIFARFFRVDKSRSRKTGGSGLGLAIAKEVVELHGGSIEVKSDRSGSIFRVTLPTQGIKT